MLEIAEREITLYLDVMALVTMIGFMLISERFRQRKTAGDKIFFIMCINVLIFTLFSMAQNLIPRGNPELHKQLLLVFETILELAELFLTYQWILFIGYWIYESADHLKRRYWGFLLPLGIITVLYAVNLFKPILFFFNDEFRIVPMLLYFLVMLVQLTYFIISGVLVWKNNRTVDRMKVFHFAPILAAFIFGFIQLVFSRIDTSPISFTAGVIFVFFSMTERWQYDSEIPGFYHAAMISYMKDQSLAGKEDYWSSIVFTAGGDDKALAEIIRKELPRRGRPVHLGNGSFAVFLDKGKDDLKDMISFAITDAAREYDDEHKDNPIALSVEVRDRKRDETIEQFLAVS